MPAPPVTIPVSSRRHRGSVNATAWLSLVTWAAAFLAWVAMPAVDVKTVLATGPIIVLLALAGFAVGCVARYRLGALLFLPHLATPVLMFLLVQIFYWGPREAALPFAIIGGAHVALTAPAVVWVWRRRPVAWQPWQCQACGYVLAGIPSTRCPECGTTFDPQAVALCQPADLPRV